LLCKPFIGKSSQNRLYNKEKRKKGKKEKRKKGKKEKRKKGKRKETKKGKDTIIKDNMIQQNKYYVL